MSKNELLDRIAQRRAEWELLLAQVDKQRMSEPGVSGEWSVKDIIAHIAWYEWWSAEFIRTKNWPRLPAHLESDDTETRNNAYFAANRDAPLEEIMEAARESYIGLMEALRNLTDAEYEDPSLLGMPDEPEWRITTWIPENTYLHYEEHAAAIRAWLARSNRPASARSDGDR